MGQKTHPLGFRLGITQQHKSTWYAKLNEYAPLLKEDHKIRTYLNSIAKFNSISNVQIDRTSSYDQIQVTLESGKPGLVVGEDATNLQQLLTRLKTFLPSNRELIVDVLEVEKIDLSATLLAYSVAEQLEKRIAFRRAIRDVLQKAQKQNVKGIKIQVSGRLNGAEIARSEWIREGRVPLQTLSADIDYATTEANTIYGVLGIKVWLFKGELVPQE